MCCKSAFPVSIISRTRRWLDEYCYFNGMTQQKWVWKSMKGLERFSLYTRCWHNFLNNIDQGRTAVQRDVCLNDFTTPISGPALSRRRAGGNRIWVNDHAHGIHKRRARGTQSVSWSVTSNLQRSHVTSEIDVLSLCLSKKRCEWSDGRLFERTQIAFTNQLIAIAAIKVVAVSLSFL